MANTEAMLTAVGARRPAPAPAADGFEAALLDYVCDIDLTSQIAVVDATPIPIAALRAQAVTPPKRRLSWRVLVPATSSGIAAVAVVVAMAIGGSSTAPGPKLSATAESEQLLTHAGALLWPRTTRPQPTAPPWSPKPRQISRTSRGCCR
ncbi:MAG: hypothetical protein ACTHK4_16805 [Mycobacteriales bacterium]